MTLCTVTVTPLMAGSCNHTGSTSSSPKKSVILLDDDGMMEPHIVNNNNNSSSSSSRDVDVLPHHATITRRQRSCSSSSLSSCSTATSSSTSSSSCTDTATSMEQDVKFMLSQLTPQELELAARTSYDYLTGNPSRTGPAEFHARAMAERYLKSKKGDPQFALSKLKATLAFRKDVDLEGLMLAFNSNSNNEIAQPLEKFLATGKNYVMSHDKQGRATHVFVPRHGTVHHPVWSLKESLYTMERAIACSRAPDSSVNAILDCRGFSPISHAPPPSFGKDFLMTFRQHYAGQVHKVFIVDAPKSFEWTWKVFSRFLGKATRQKILFVSGTTQKQEILSQYYDPQQVAEWMMPGCGATKNRELDVQEYLYKTPFDRAFDE